MEGSGGRLNSNDGNMRTMGGQQQQQQQRGPGVYTFYIIYANNVVNSIL